MADLLNLDSISAQNRYKLLSALVIPRPVAWVTTVNAQGVVNAAPYSFFNVFGRDPALIILGLQHKPDGSAKDTTRNIDAAGEFVVILATPALIADMVRTAASYDPGESEPNALGLKLAPSGRRSRCNRMRTHDGAVAERGTVDPSGRAVGWATRDGLVDTDTMYVDWADDYPVARLFADRYARLEEIERHSIPDPYRPETSGEDRE